MKASRCPTACVARMFAMLTPVVLLVQCAMPPREAWHSIQTNGLIPYLTSARPSPPFRTGALYAHRYSSYTQRPRYGTGYTPNNYFSTLSTGLGSSRYVPRKRSSSSSLVRSPDVKIPVEEPVHTAPPRIAHNPPPVSPAPKNTDSAEATTESLPYGAPVPGRINMVNSPFAGKTQLVDVSGMSAGQTVKCPYTGKLFKVPPTQQAANNVESRLESKPEAPKASEEPKAEDKKP
ncbi:MAG: hypothetical protein WAW39_01430 [Prosthecobacter sp.]|uniref:hypothetical protein n=1 Tax=Prosthecobacter sp. TaxID=1965333 RepID=UPI003BAE8D99